MPVIAVKDDNTGRDLYISYDRSNLIFRDIVDSAELVTTWTELYNMVKNDKRND